MQVSRQVCYNHINKDHLMVYELTDGMDDDDHVKNEDRTMKRTKTRKALCLYLVLLLSACLCFPAWGEEIVDPVEDTMHSWPFSSEIREPYSSVMDSEGTLEYRNEENAVTFMTGPLPYGLITDEEEAASVACHFVSETGLDMQWRRTDSCNGVVCYTFQAMEDGLDLRDCYVKIVVSDTGEIWGIASSLPENTDSVLREEPGEDLRQPINLNADYESGMYETMLVTRSEETLDISIPVLISPEDGGRYLGDHERRIYCVDPSSLENDNGESPIIRPLCLDDGMDMTGPVITYYRFLQVYDYFDGKSWPSPDGNAGPCLLMIDFTGESDGNAYYGGFRDGFHCFGFGTNDYASQSIQVIAHEFMHGVSATNHIGRYENETGALNEAISDLIGSAVEADIMGMTMEQDGWLQSFKESHQDEYPLFIWDEYYTPSTDTPDQDVNDLGSVHHNANIVNVLSYRQAEAGMTPSDRFDYWFLFDLTLTPVTDFPEFAARAAWCAELAGLSRFAPMMAQAAADLGLHDRSIPDKPRMDHQALVLVDMVWQERDLPGIVTFYNTGSKRKFSTWPAAGTSTAAAVLAEGEYIISIVIHSDPEACFLWNGEDWQPCGQEEIEKARGEAGRSCRVILNGGDVAALGDFYEK